MNPQPAPVTADDRIKCKICGELVHSIELHIGKSHKDETIEGYRQKFPGAPELSERAKAKIKERKDAKDAETAASLEMSAARVVPIGGHAPNTILRKPLHEVFGLGEVKGAMSGTGKPIPIATVEATDSPEMVPDIVPGYVFNLEELKNIMLGIELGIPTYCWGHKGSGKSELFSQIAARTGRPLSRVQHTVNTEESHIVGQWTVRKGETVFELGPLPTAMKMGWLYLADEYDFALPSVLSVYQAVLEGKPLVIKEADAANRIIRPHANFRFAATGNTNGSGDETGLYQGTMIQNSANYDRFGIVVHKKYMDAIHESVILQNQAKLAKADADKLAQIGQMVREAYAAGKISDTVSPRALIYAGIIGVKRGSLRQGLELSFINKLNKVDTEVVNGLAQRVLG